MVRQAIPMLTQLPCQPCTLYPPLPGPRAPPMLAKPFINAAKMLRDWNQNTPLRGPKQRRSGQEQVQIEG